MKTIILAALLAVSAVALPYHYLGHFEFDWTRHLGPIYVATVIFVIGALLALRAMSCLPQ